MFILLLLLTTVILCSEEKAQLEKFHHKQPSSELGGALPDANSYWEGWVHYYHYSSGAEIKRPKVFFQNNEFFHQRVPLSHVKKTDRFGSLIIPNKSSFYAVLTPNAIQIYTSRDDSIKNQVDYLQYEYINTIPEDSYLHGGIEDLGSFSIGHCIQLKTKLPNGKEVNDMSNTLNTNWIMCVDKEKEKQKLLKTLLKLKFKQQRTLGEFKTEETMKIEQKAKTTADLLFQAASKIPADDRSSNKVETPRDGYWILLQNWTDCTLKCGGGESFQQWQCVPPRNGGKPCQGKAIRVRKCNLQPCPGVSSLLTTMKATEPEVKAPIVKVAPFSSRLQRYSKCVVKENDAFLSNRDEKTGNDAKMPVRVVMNNLTLTVFKDDFYQDVEYSYELAKTQFKVLSNDFCCFELQDPMRKLRLCGYEKFCGTPQDNKWVNQWSQDFTLFKVDCHVGRQETLLTPEDEKALADDLKRKLGQARLDLIGDKQKKLRQSMMTTENNNYKLKVQKVQDTGFAAIEKELQLENLIKNEEKAKEDMEVQALMKKIEKEKEKQACLRNTIKERDLDAEFLAERRSSEQEVKEIKAEVAQQVKIKRAKMKKMIEQMRAKTRLRKAALENELNTLRQKMAKDMLQANKNGDIEKCKAGKTDADKREAYCNANYVDDFVRNSDCKSQENFCYMCCESEFGNMFIDRRESCYNMCDLPVAPAPAVKKGDGPWMWTPKVGQ
jgi:hypothetical protein